MGADNNSDRAKFIQVGGMRPGLASVNDVLHPATPKPGTSAEAKQTKKIDFMTKDEDEARRKLGMSDVEFGDAVHSLKKAFGIGGADNLQFHIPSGNVFYNGQHIGNLFDE